MISEYVAEGLTKFVVRPGWPRPTRPLTADFVREIMPLQT